MNKRDVIELFLKNGIMLAPEEVETIDEKNYMHLLEKKLGGAKKDDIVVAGSRKGKMSCNDFIKLCNDKFEFLRGLLLKKTDAVSINKGRKIFSEVTIIGRVKETTARGFVIEDVTGETEVVTDKNHVTLGDVAGLKGHFKDNLFFPSQLIWPDIPLDAKVKPEDIKITLATKVREATGGIIICPSAKTAGNVIGEFGSFGLISISRHGKDFVVAAYAPSRETGEEEAIRILKKRLIPEDGLPDNVIKEVPDVFWLSRNGKNWVRNYRGVTIISTAPESLAEVHGSEVNFGNV